MKEWVRRLERAKAHVDKGFSAVGRQLDAADPAQRALTLLASRSLAVSNAVAQLSLHNHANEVLPLVRSLYEIAAAMSWIADKDGKERAEKFLAEPATSPWPEELLKKRLPEGPHEEMAQAWASFRFGNAATVPWGHVFQAGAEPMPAEKGLALAARAMAIVLKSLDKTWGKFPGAQELLAPVPESEEATRKESL